MSFRKDVRAELAALRAEIREFRAVHGVTASSVASASAAATQARDHASAAREDISDHAQAVHEGLRALTGKLGEITARLPLRAVEDKPDAPKRPGPQIRTTRGPAGLPHKTAAPKAVQPAHQEGGTANDLAV